MAKEDFEEIRKRHLLLSVIEIGCVQNGPLL